MGRPHGNNAIWVPMVDVVSLQSPQKSPQNPAKISNHTREALSLIGVAKSPYGLSWLQAQHDIQHSRGALTNQAAEVRFDLPKVKELTSNCGKLRLSLTFASLSSLAMSDESLSLRVWLMAIGLLSSMYYPA